MLFKPIQRESALFVDLGGKWAPQRPEVSRGPWLNISCSRYAYGPILAVLFFFFLMSLMSGARCEERSTKNIFEVKSEDVGTVEVKSVLYG